jgi:hypothetical protein
LARPQAVPAPDERLGQLEAAAELLQHEVDAMRAALIDLYGRMGYHCRISGPTSAAMSPQRSASAG